MGTWARASGGEAARAAAAAAFAMLLAACGGGEDLACTAELRPAIELSIVDASGTARSGVVVTWSVDGGTPKAVVCDATAPCAFGHEVPGLYAVAAAKPGYATATTTLLVFADRCHVITERRTLVLRPAG